MLRMLLRRLFLGAVTVAIVSVIIFSGVELLPGDACTASLLTARLQGRSWQNTLDLANRHGAFVASQPGATPRLPAEILGFYKLFED